MKYDSLVDTCCEFIYNRHSFFYPQFDILTEDARRQIEEWQQKKLERIGGRVYITEPCAPKSDWECYRW